MMKAIGIIPARWHSERFEGKVLANLLGKPLVQHVWESAKQSRILEDVIIATDSEDVIKAVKGFGGKAVYTSKDQPSGTDRIAEVINPIETEVVVNIQGDEPLVHYSMIDGLAGALLENSSVQMATVIKKINDKAEFLNPSVVKVVVDKNGYALYFSRSPIPYARGEEADGKLRHCYKHIGIYAYTKDFLFTYTNLPKSALEDTEKLEQLRVLENGYRIKTFETEFDTIGVDTPEDLKKAEEILKSLSF